MRSILSLALAASLAAVLVKSAPTVAEPSAHTLPILFLNGYGSNSAVASGLQQNLSTDARPFIGLTACENECSTRPLQEQLPLVIDQIRSITTSDKRFADGYVLIGISQGGALVRGVAAEMDDHKIHTLVSLAGGCNGLFYGPQASDALPARGFLDVLAPIMTSKELFDYTKYTDADIASGKMVTDWIKLHIAHPELQSVGAGYNLYRSPVASSWNVYSPFFPVVGNLQDATQNESLARGQQRRKQNFLRLREAHFFASPVDAGVSPWQSGLLGAYETVDSIESLERDFHKLRVLPMEQTPEYIGDTYGLASLHRRGGLFLHEVPNVSHGCWVMDEMPYNGTVECKFRPVFEKTLYPLLGPKDAAACK